MQTVESALKGKKHFIFDLDDTLINSEKCHQQGVFELHKMFSAVKNLYQLFIEAYKELEIAGNLSGIEIRHSLYDRFQLRLHAVFNWRHVVTHEDLDAIYWSGAGKYVELLPDAAEVLFSLREQGKTISILTNGGRVQHLKVRELIGKLGPWNLVDDYVVTGDYGEDYYKPDPRCLLKIVGLYTKTFKAHLNNFVYIGDRIYEDAGVAKSAGVDFVLYDPMEIHEDYSGVRIFNLMELVA